jgi:hypothetical protein
MSISIPDFKIRLEGCAEEQLFAFIQEANYLASNIYNEYDLEGLYATGSTMANADWLAYLTAKNITLGIAAPGPNPERNLPAAPIMFDGHSTAGTIARYNHMFALQSGYQRSLAAYKVKLIDAVGPTIMAALHHPVYGLQKVTCTQIMQHLYDNFGVLSSESLSRLTTQINLKFTQTDLPAFFANVTSLESKLKILELHNQPISNIDKCKLLMNAISGFQGYHEVRRQFLYAYPLVQDQTLGNLRAFIGTHFSTFTSVQDVNQYALSFSVSRSSSPSRPRSPGPPQSRKVSRRPSPVSKKIFCFHHGWNNSHTGKECLFMKTNINPKTNKPFKTKEINANGSN